MSAVAAPLDVLTLRAREHPDKLAVVEDRPLEGGGFRRTRWTFADLEEEANRLSNALLGLGVQSGDRLIWCGMNSPGIVRVMHAARKIRATAVPLNYRLRAEEAAYVIENSDAVLAYLDAEQAPLFAEIRGQLAGLRELVVFDGAAPAGFHSAEALMAAASPGQPRVEWSPREPATMTYTSGTTGKPKGALRRGLGKREQVRQLVESIGYAPDDVYLTTGPLYHSGPGGFMAVAHNLGNTVVLQRRFDPEHWLQLVQDHRVTTTFCAPTPIRRVCQLPAEVKAGYERSSMRRFIANAAPWSHALKLSYLADFPNDSLFEVYGSTEMGVNTVLHPEDQLRKPGSCGKPAPGVELVLFDEQGRRIVEPNTPGELFARSGVMFDAYHKAQEKYEEDRRGDYHTVGDVAFFDEEGFFYICDRKTDMIVSGGVNIYPAEVEAALEHHADVSDVAVFGIPSDEWGEAVHAVLVLRTGAEASQERITEFARAHLAGYKVPRSMEFVQEIPRNASGKILKRQLREPFWDGRDRRVS